MIYFTSDYHFYHTNVLKYCNRPFSTVEEMNEFLISQWRQTVKPHDEVYFLGDFTLTRRKDLIDAILNRLTGRIKLVSGNHDSGLLKYYGRGQIHNFAQCSLEILPDLYRLKYNKNVFLLCHYPVLNWGFEDFMLHGHCHGKKQFLISHSVDVGWDCHKKPISIDEITQFLVDRDGPIGDRRNRKIIQ